MVRKRSSSHSGVSEVIGTILVLLITVVIFSSIILWVYTIPTPTARERVSIDGQLIGLYSGGSWAGAVINLTHRGGDSLLGGGTRVFVTIDNETELLFTQGSYFDGISIKSYGINGPDLTWNIGETWTYLNQSIPEGAQVSVMVVDLDRGLVLWDKGLLGVTGARGPVFLDKWVDADPATPTRDPLNAGDPITFYARVYDPDGDLNRNSVWGYLTFGIGGAPFGYIQLVDNGDVDAGDKTAGDGIFSRSLIWNAQQAWDGGIIILNATDLGGRETESRLTLSVGEEGGGPGAQKGPEDLGFGSGLQKWDIFEANDWDANRFQANSTRAFAKGETLVVVIASQYLKNADQVNRFYLYDPAILPVRPIVYGPPPYVDPVGPGTLPSSTNAFAYFGFIGDYYIYEHRFSTDSSDYGEDGVQLGYGHYTLEIELQANEVAPPQNRFATLDHITITDLSGGFPDFPDLRFYRDPGHTQEANLFNSTDTLYVKIIVDTTDVNVDVDDVTITDFLGRSPIWSTPGNPPISEVTVNDSRSYAFSIDLSDPNFDNWNFGLSSYGFRIKRVADTNEEYTLASQLLVRGPRWALDSITALNEITLFIFGEEETWYSTFNHNDGVWSRTIVESWRDNTCFWIFCFNDPPWGGGDFLDVALGDLDEDGDLDAVFGLQVGKVFWYRNVDGDGGQWSQYEIDTVPDDVQAVAIGPIDRDTDNDVVAGTSTGEVWYYTNDGSWSSTLIVNLPTGVNVIKVADATGDGFNDILVGTQDGNVYIYINNGFGVFGTQLTADYTFATDRNVEGSVFGDVSDTHTSDDTYESIQEVIGPGETVDWYIALNEWIPAFGIVKSGSYVDTWAEDLSFEQLSEEEEPDELWPLGDDAHYYIRNSSTGNPPGHLYYMGNIPLDSGDQVYLVTSGFLSQGTEPMQIGWKGSNPDVNILGDLRETTWTRKIFDLTADGFDGGDLYAIVQDSDTSIRDVNSDGMITEISMDAVVVAVIRASGNTSRLEHQWQSGVIGSGGDSYKFFVEAHHSITDDDDDFRFQWATTDKGPWAELVTVTKTEDDDTYQAVALPRSVAGTSIWVRVVDQNRSDGGLSLDTIHIDHMFVRRYIAQPTFDAIPVGAAVNDLTLADMDLDGDLEVIVGAGSDARVYYGTSWGSSVILHADGTVNAVDVGYIDGDGTFDVVVGTASDRVYWFANDLTWSRTLIASLSSDATSLRVGDVDGDYLDDVVVSQGDGIVRWLRHDQGTSWQNMIVDAITTLIYAIDIGDVDRGVTIEPWNPPSS